jgi:hypothetical protein
LEVLEDPEVEPSSLGTDSPGEREKFASLASFWTAARSDELAGLMTPTI